MKMRGLLVGGTVVVVAVASLAACGSSSAGAATQLEPSNNAGADPFTNSVAIGPAVAFPANVQAITASNRKTLPTDPQTHTLSATGTAPGLYGGTGNAQVCDARQLVTFLQQNPAKGSAWAGVEGIAPADIGKYVATLTPIILTGDTLVTNHGYVNGHATTLQSVLQAGTAVMVDTTGVPRAKCNCGNPLTPADPSPIGKTQGVAWPGYTSTQVIVVNAGSSTQKFTLINVNTGDTYPQPAGSGGNQQWVVTEIANPSAANATTIAVSPDGKKWSNVTTLPNDQFNGLAYGNGVWAAITTTQAGENVGVDTSTDLKSWRRAFTAPGMLTGVAYGNGRWVAVGEANATNPTGAIYTSSDAQHWTQAYSTPVGTSTSFTAVAFGDNRFVAFEQQQASNTFALSEMTSTDGTNWSPLTSPAVGGDVTQAATFGENQWARAAYAASGATPPSISVSPDAKAWTAVPNSPQANAIGFGDGTFLTVDNTHPQPNEDDDGPVVAKFSTSTDAKTWTPTGGQVNWQVTAIVYGAVPSNTKTTPSTTPTTTVPTPATTTPPATTPVTSPANNGAAVRSFDWNNYTYKDFFCQGGMVKFTNGQYHGTGVWADCGEWIGAIDYADVTGDGVTDAIVNINGSPGGTALGAGSYTGVFTMGPNGPVNVGYVSGASFPPYTGSIVAWVPDPGPSDPACCPSNFTKTTYTYSPGSKSFVKGSSSVVPASQEPKR